MGIVYRAHDVKLNRDVALKVLPPELLTNPERKRRFVQEAQAAAALEHPHIAVVYEIDESDEVTFIAMELIRGEKLSDLLARGKLGSERTLELAIEGTPVKEHVIFETGHVLTGFENQATKKILEWFDQHLGPV